MRGGFNFSKMAEQERTALLVREHPNATSAVEAVLEGVFGFKVEALESADEAMVALSEMNTKVRAVADLVLTDLQFHEDGRLNLRGEESARLATQIGVPKVIIRTFEDTVGKRVETGDVRSITFDLAQGRRTIEVPRSVNVVAGWGALAWVERDVARQFNPIAA